MAQIDPLDTTTEGVNPIQTAIGAGIALAGPQNPIRDHAKPYVLIPEGYNFQQIDADLSPDRKTGTVKVYDVQSFIEYVLRHKSSDTVIYGKADPAQFIAVLNDHGATSQTDHFSSDGACEDDQNAARWRDFRANYTPALSKEWVTWHERNRKDFPGNREFAEWLEDNLVDIIDPANNAMMEMALKFAVSTNAAFSNPVDLSTGSTRFSYTLEAKTGDLEVPKSFVLELPVFQGIDARRYRLEARFRYKVANSGVTMRYELVRPHKVLEQAFKDEVESIRELTAVPVLFGEP
jgi:uncharacterized protein YfdQ (DUF2303 family)